MPNLVFTLDTRAARVKIEAIQQSLHKVGLKKALHRIGARGTQYLRRRWINLSAGQGGWAPLDIETVKRKIRSGSPHPSYILRDRDHLLNSISYYVRQNTVSMGILSTKKHPNSKKTYRQLAQIHNRTRKIAVVPPARLQKDFSKIFREELGESIKGLE